MLDPSGNGLGCYDKQDYGSDDVRKCIVVAMFGGYFGERRFCKENSYLIIETPDEWFRCNPDGADAAKLLPPADFYPQMPVAERMVDKHWSVIKELAAELQSRDWEPIKPLGSGFEWWNEGETVAKYVTGEELIGILAARGIAASLV